MTEAQLIHEGWARWNALSEATLVHAIDAMKAARGDERWAIQGIVTWREAPITSNERLN